MPFRDGLQFTTDGAVYVTPRVGRVPTTALYRNGWARTPDGYGYVVDAGSAVPSGAQYRDGMAFTDDGALYVTNSTPSGSNYRAGKAIRADGALHVNLISSTGQTHGGWRVDSDKRAYLSLSPLTGAAAHFRYGVGITVTGAGVSTWADQSGNGRDLLQGTDTNRPALQTDNSILFDGADNFLNCSTFTFAQPETIYLLLKQVTWTSTDRLFDGNTLNSGGCAQVTASPQINVNVSGTALASVSPTLDAYFCLAVVFNGASSVLQLNNDSPNTGSVGVGDMSGFTLGANATPGQYGNIQVKEVILYPAAHDATNRASLINYLSIVGGLGINA